MAGVYSVTQVNSYIKNMFTQDFLLRRLSVKGEVSNCKYHTSGHIYFTLKDGGGTLSAVMFAGQRKGLKFRLSEGQQVVVKGTVDVYERDGKYQLYASEIELEGRGDLFLQFEKLRDELEEMGMFDACYKQDIPRFAMKIGVVTAPTGAAVRDIINISKRRNPYVQIILYPALVQGAEAKFSIAKGIKTLDDMGLDVLIVGRGGGSIEDLWAFNEELVARAIFACKTPVISAVGHETDVTIADYVADLRAPTPSAAAELAVFDFTQFEGELEGRKRRLIREMMYRLDRARDYLKRDELQMKIYHPRHQIYEKRQRIADLEEMLNRAMTGLLREDRQRLAVVSEKLWGLSPLRKLSQGYGFITDQDGNRLESVAQAPPGDVITVRVADGSLKARVTERQEAAAWQN